MRHVCIIVVAILVAVAPATLSAGQDPRAAGIAVDVSVHVAFDRTLSSRTLREVAETEAAAIWVSYGIHLLWSNDDDEDTFVRPSVLEVIVVRESGRESHDRDGRILGSAVVPANVVNAGPIMISYDAIDSLLLTQPEMKPLAFRERDIAIALGRVLAHELGHVFLGPPVFHDHAGLMRTSYAAADLTRARGNAFGLTNASVDRLRQRISSLSRMLPPPRIASVAFDDDARAPGRVTP